MWAVRIEGFSVAKGAAGSPLDTFIDFPLSGCHSPGTLGLFPLIRGSPLVVLWLLERRKNVLRNQKKGGGYSLNR